MAWRGLPMTCMARATFSYTVLEGSSRKSWKTEPIWRRSFGTAQVDSLDTSLPSTHTLPLVAFISRMTSCRNVDLPEPDLPTRNTNSSRSTSSETWSSAGWAPGVYTMVTSSKRIMGPSDQGQ